MGQAGEKENKQKKPLLNHLWSKPFLSSNIIKTVSQAAVEMKLKNKLNINLTDQ